MKHTIAAAILFAVALAGCDATAPVKTDMRTAREMPADAALSYVRNPIVPAGSIAEPVEARTRCGPIANGSMAVKSAQEFPYAKLTLDVTTAGGRYKSARFAIVESTWTWCDYHRFGWDSENVETHRRALAEIDRIATAFAALGVRIARP